MKRVYWFGVLLFGIFASASAEEDTIEGRNNGATVYVNQRMFAPTKVDYQDIFGKNSLLNSGDPIKSFAKIAGFSVAKKGGGGGEVFYRSQGGGRLPIFVDGGNIQGACGGKNGYTANLYLSTKL